MQPENSDTDKLTSDKEKCKVRTFDLKNCVWTLTEIIFTHLQQDEDHRRSPCSLWTRFSHRRLRLHTRSVLLSGQNFFFVLHIEDEKMSSWRSQHRHVYPSSMDSDIFWPILSGDTVVSVMPTAALVAKLVLAKINTTPVLILNPLPHQDPQVLSPKNNYVPSCRTICLTTTSTTWTPSLNNTTWTHPSVWLDFWLR